jgi:hypothetical protein
MKILVDEMPEKPEDCLFSIGGHYLPECFFNCNSFCDVEHCKHLIASTPININPKPRDLSANDIAFLDTDYLRS